MSGLGYGLELGLESTLTLKQLYYNKIDLDRDRGHGPDSGAALHCHPRKL